MEGWIKIHRRLTEWEWYTDINTFKLFMHLVLKANHKNNTHRGQLVKRGQLITGRYKLSSETGLSERQVRTALDKLLATNEVTSETTNKNSLITIINYDLYQNSETDRPAERPAKSPTNDQPLDHKQEVKNEKKKEIEVWFIDWFNFSMDNLKGSGKYKLNLKVKRQLHDRIKDGYTGDNFKHAFEAISKDQYHKDKGYKYLTPEFITRADKLEMWSNATITKLEEEKGKGKGGISMEEMYNS
jgi:hypothetical protein